MNLIKILSENFSFSFSGRVNILSKVNKQYLGAIIQSEGKIVNAKYLNLSGKKALASVLMELKSSKVFSFVSEPEVVSPGDHVFDMSEGQFLKFKNDYFEQYDELNKLRPDNSLRLAVDGIKFNFNTGLSKVEFDVLCGIIDYSTVKEIYQFSDLLDFDITTALISLRKKGILRVLRA
jgi:hypothetical protein